MECRSLDVNIVSAKDFKFEKKERIYAEVSIAGYTTGYVDKFKTPVSRVSHETDTTWNFPVKLAMSELNAKKGHLALVIKIKAKRFFSDKLIGEVHYPIRTLIKGATAKGKPMEAIVWEPFGINGGAGAVEFTYKFGEIYLYKPKPNPEITSTTATDGSTTNSSVGFGTGSIGGLIVADIALHAGGDTHCRPWYRANRMTAQGIK